MTISVQAQRLKEIRTKLRLTQTEFGQILNQSSKSYVCLLESGKRNIPLFVKDILYDQYNINPDYLENGNTPIILPSSTENKINKVLGCADTDSRKQLVLRILSMSDYDCDELITLLNSLTISAIGKDELIRLIGLLTKI